MPEGPGAISTVEVFWDYCCPFTRNLSLGLLAWTEEADTNANLVFHPFSLMQHLLRRGETALWDRGPQERWGINALLWGIAVQHHAPEVFPDFHRAVFDERFEFGREPEDISVLRAVTAQCGLSTSAVEARANSDRNVKRLRTAHSRGVSECGVFGVPTLVVHGVATFVRVLDPSVDTARSTVELLQSTSLHEFKRTGPAVHR